MESRDLVDGAMPLQSSEPADSVTLLTHLKRRESVAKMTWDGLSYLATAVVRFKSSGTNADDAISIRSRSVAHTMSLRAPTTETMATALTPPTALPPDVTMDTGGTTNLAADSLEDEVFFDIPPPSYEDVVDAGQIPAPLAPAALRRESVREPRYVLRPPIPPTAN